MAAVSENRCRITIHQRTTAIVPPIDAHLAVLLHLPLTPHKQMQLVPQFLTSHTVALEYIEQVGRQQ